MLIARLHQRTENGRRYLHGRTLVDCPANRPIELVKRDDGEWELHVCEKRTTGKFDGETIKSFVDFGEELPELKELLGN